MMFSYFLLCNICNKARFLSRFSIFFIAVNSRKKGCIKSSQDAKLVKLSLVELCIKNNSLF